jgi:hypothetical protein
MATVGRKSCTVNVLKLLARHLEAYLTGTPPPAPEQRVNDRLEQRVTEDSILAMTPLPEIQRVSDAPPAMVANNPTSKRIMQKKTHTHQCATRGNTPGALPHIVRPLDLSPEGPFQIPHIIEELPKSAKNTKWHKEESEWQPRRAHHDVQRDSSSRTTTYIFVTPALLARRH